MPETAEYRNVKCSQCNHLVMYNHTRGKAKNIKTLCLDCLINKKKKEMIKARITNNIVLRWDD